MPSTSLGKAVPASVLPAALALVLVVASVAAVAGAGPAPGADPAAVSTETRTATPATETPTTTPVNRSDDLNLTLLAGPGTVFEKLDDYGIFRSASNASALERTGRVRRGETLVVAFRSERLNRSYAAAEATGTTPRFFEAVNRTNATVSVTAPAVPSCQPLRIDLQRSRVRALVERDGPGFAVAIRTDAVATEGGCGSGLQTPGDYQITVEVPTANGSQRSTAVFELFDGPQRAADEARVHRGASSLAPRLDSATAVRRATRNHTLVPSARVVREGIAVLSFRSERLNRTYANTSGSNATARLSAAVEATGGTLSLATPRRSADEAGRVVLGGPGIRTLYDPGNATFHLIIDTERARLRQEGGTLPLSMASERELEFDLRVPLEDGDTRRFEAQLFLTDPGGQLRVGRNRSALSSRGSGMAVVGTDGRFVAVPETNLAPGWNLTVRAVGPNGTTLATREGRSEGDTRDERALESPRSDGPVYGFDLGSLSGADRFHVTLHAANETLDRVPVAVGERPTLRNATARRVAGFEGANVRFAVTVHYPGPGFVVVRTEDGYTGFEVPAGEPTRVRGTVQVPSADHREEFRLIAVYDSNGNGVFDGPGGGETTDQPFPGEEGGILQTSASLPPPTPTPTITAPPPGTTIPMTGSDGQPGFGPLAAVGAGLAALALTAGRRRLRDSG